MKKVIILLALVSTAMYAQVSDRKYSATLTSTCSNATTSCDTAGTTSFGQNGEVVGPQTLEANITGYGIATITARGTFTGSQLSFEFSDDGGTSWFATVCARSDSSVLEGSSTLVDNTQRGWDCGIAAANRFRVRQTAITTGGPIVSMTLSSAQFEPAQTVSAVGGAASGAVPIGAPLLTGGIFETTPTTVTNGQLSTLHVDASGRVLVVPPDATGATTVAGPLPIGCAFNSASPTVTTGQSTYIRCSATGALSIATVTSVGDGVSGASVGVAAASSTGGALTSGLRVQPMVYNGTTLDTLRGDTRGLEVHGSRTGIACQVAVSTATTLSAVGSPCAAPGAGLSIYITDITFGSSAASGTAADSFPTLKSGTTGTCGTGTAVIWQALTAANTTQETHLLTPIKVAANSEVCWIMSTAGSKTINISGFIAP